MFDNVGGQIKSFAKFYMWLMMIIGLLFGGAIYAFFESVMGASVILCLLLLVIGGCVGWLSGYIGAVFLYAFGELVESNQRMSEILEQRNQSDAQTFCE